MAKRKKTKSVRRTSRRRISGVGGDFMTKAAGAIVGYVGGKMLSSKLLPNLDDKIKGAGVAAIGALAVPRFIKGAMGEGLSIGLVVAGGDTLLRGTGLIAGMLDKPVMYLPYGNRVAGDGIATQVAGGGISAQVAGDISGTQYARAKAEA